MKSIRKIKLFIKKNPAIVASLLNIMVLLLEAFLNVSSYIKFMKILEHCNCQ